MIAAVTFWLVWHEFFPKTRNTSHPKTTHLQEKKKIQKEKTGLGGKARAEASLPRFSMAQVPSARGTFLKVILKDSGSIFLYFFF